MPVESSAPVSAASLYTAPEARAPKQTMDGDMFMQLLITQLQNQDPSSPMDTNEMVSQQTQMAMMESLNKVSTSIEEGFSLQMRSAAASLLGESVSYTGADGSTVTGIATSVSYAGPVPSVTVGGVNVALDAVSAVTAAPSS